MIADYYARRRALDESGKPLSGEISIYATWYPTLEKLLMLLSRIYRCLEPSTFEGLAYEAVDITVRSLQRGGDAITAKTSALDGQLFLIKHLLILREQISPFDVDFLSTAKSIDFTSTAEAFSSFISSIGGIFTLNGNNSLLNFIYRGLPGISATHTDAKKDIERELKSNCEAFILNITVIVIGPLLEFLKKASAFSSISAEAVSSPDRSSLATQSFASPTALSEVLASCSELIQSKLPPVMAKMGLYLHNTTTQSILFKPVKDNITEGLARCMQCVNVDYAPVDRPELIKSIEHLQELVNSQSFS